MSKNQSTVSRREFLSSAAVIGAAGTVGAGSLLTACTGGNNENKLTPLRLPGEYYIPELGDKAIEGKPIKAALIGCGDRGTGAARNFLSAGDGLSIVAFADVFKDKIDACQTRLKAASERPEANFKFDMLPDDRCFVGFDAYKKVCALPEVDYIIIATPSIFHPDHTKYAIDQGKHTFCEKAACIDAVGYRTFMMAVRQAQSNNLCLCTGTQRNHHRGYIESYKKVQEGYIGRITSGNVYWNQGHFNFRRRVAGETDMEYMLRDFFSWNWLCGDHIIDQGVHNIDVFTWFSHLKPKFVIGMGSQLRRLTGDIYDNHSADIEYEGGVHLHVMARQIDSCYGRVAEIIQGTKGSWNSLGNEFTILDLDGNVVWKWDREANNEQFKQNDPYVLEHLNVINHIRSNKAMNQYAETTAISSMAGVMCRESAYTGKACTWDEITLSDLNLMPMPHESMHLGNVDMSKFVPPLPGTAPPWVVPPRPERPTTR